MALEHYLRKALNYQRNTISTDDTPITCDRCHAHFKNIRNALQHFSSEIKFEDLYLDEEDGAARIAREEALLEQQLEPESSVHSMSEEEFEEERSAAAAAGR